MALRIGRSRLLEHLKRIGMTQAQYAKRMNLSEGFVSKLVSGEKKLSVIKLKMTADLCNCHMDDLYTWEYK